MAPEKYFKYLSNQLDTSAPQSRAQSGFAMFKIPKSFLFLRGERYGCIALG